MKIPSEGELPLEYVETNAALHLQARNRLAWTENSLHFAVGRRVGWRGSPH